jgi:transposase
LTFIFVQLEKHAHVANTESGIAELVGKLKSYDLNIIVIEATGGLETELIIQLQAALLPVALINPRQGRDFALSYW